MGPHGFDCQGWMLIPLIICILIMVFRGFSKGRMPFGAVERANSDFTENDSVKDKTDEILKMRLAKGEISIDEYEKMKDALA